MTILSGRLTKDAELTHIGANNTPKARFSLAVERNYQKDKANKVVDFVEMELLGARAEALAKHLTKGKAVLIHGELNIDKYKNDKGENRSVTKVKVDRIEFLSSSVPVATQTTDVPVATQKVETSKVEYIEISTNSPTLDDDDVPF
jgi:single-strand DNA-binding protein